MLEIDFSHRDQDLREILEDARVIAIVGESNDHYYSSYQVAQYLKEMGYTVYPVNPNIQEVDGDRSYPSLAEVPEPIDIVDVFRKPEYLDEIVAEAIAAGAKVLWAQLDVVTSDQGAEQKAYNAGLKVVSDRCIRTEHERLKIPAKPVESTEREGHTLGTRQPDLTQPVGLRDHVQGPPGARVTLLVYGDYECPYTRKSLLVVKQLRNRLGDLLRFVFRNFPLDRIHPHAVQAAEAAEAAAAQGSEQFWKMHAYLFDHQDALEGADLREYAAFLGLDTARFDRDLAERTYRGRIQEDIQSGLASGVGGTPTFFINGMRHDGSWDFGTLLPAVEASPVNGQ